MSETTEVVEPERRCAKHADADEPPYYCADCSHALKLHTKWVQAQQAVEEQRERDAELERRFEEQQRAEAAIAACALCDSDGYAGGLRVCDHVDRRETARRGSALVRAELDRLATQRKAARR